MPMPKLFKTHDVFISYVVEDREVVELLYYRLKAEGLDPWYARHELPAGGDIHQAIVDGLKKSRKGISIISPDYTSKWAWSELFTLMDRGFVPVIHRMTLEQAIELNPRLSIYKCLETSRTMDYVVDEITRAIKPAPWWYRVLARWWKHLLAAAIVMTIMITSSFLYMSAIPPSQVIETTIRQHVMDVQTKANGELQDDLLKNGCTITPFEDINAEQSSFYSLFLKKPFQGTIAFDNGISIIRSLDSLINKGVFTKGSQAEPPFELKHYRSYLAPDKDPKTMRYAFMNMQPVHYKVLDRSGENETCEVRVKYTNNIRYASVNLVYNDSNKLVLRSIQLIGLHPVETIVFTNEDEEWVLQQMR